MELLPWPRTSYLDVPTLLAEEDEEDGPKQRRRHSHGDDPYVFSDARDDSSSEDDDERSTSWATLRGQIAAAMQAAAQIEAGARRLEGEERALRAERERYREGLRAHQRARQPDVQAWALRGVMPARVEQDEIGVLCERVRATGKSTLSREEMDTLTANIKPLALLEWFSRPDLVGVYSGRLENHLVLLMQARDESVYVIQRLDL